MIPIEGVLDKYGVEYDGSKDGNQQVLCPFHEDTTASGSVNLGEGLFRCFACEVRGDAISLLMSEEGLEFGDAKRIAQELADGSGAQVSRGADRGDSFLPRRSGARQNRRGWRSPWAGRKS